MVSVSSQQCAGLAVLEHPARAITLPRVGHSHQSHLPEAGQLWKMFGKDRDDLASLEQLDVEIASRVFPLAGDF